MEKFRQTDGYFYVIYKVTNLINNKFYIGRHKTKDLNDSYYGSGINILKSVEKYGKENFKREYLYFLTNQEELIQKEIELVTEELIKDDNCYNLIIGGSGSFDKATEKIQWLKDNNPDWYKEYRRKISDGIKLKALNNPNYRNTIKFWQGKTRSNEDKLKISRTRKNKCIGKDNNFYDTCYIKKNNDSIRIKNINLEKYLSDGWIKGRICKKHNLSKEESSKKFGGTTGKIAIKHEIKNVYKYINLSELEQYLLTGWVKGRITNKNGK